MKNKSVVVKSVKIKFHKIYGLNNITLFLFEHIISFKCIEKINSSNFVENIKKVLFFIKYKLKNNSNNILIVIIIFSLLS